jgi:hypothetical protein
MSEKPAAVSALSSSCSFRIRNTVRKAASS